MILFIYSNIFDPLINTLSMKNFPYLFLLGTAITFTSCSTQRINASMQDQKVSVDTKLSREEYEYIQNVKGEAMSIKGSFFKKAVNKELWDNEAELKKQAYQIAIKNAMEQNGDGIVNVSYHFEEKKIKGRNTQIMTAQAKAYRLLTNKEYLEMKKSLKEENININKSNTNRNIDLN